MLTQRQENFVTEYLATGNAAEAYRRAYPSSQKWKPESLYPKASTLLDNGKVMARIEALRTQATATTVVAAEKPAADAKPADPPKKIDLGVVAGFQKLSVAEEAGRQLQARAVATEYLARWRQ